MARLAVYPAIRDIVKNMVKWLVPNQLLPCALNAMTYNKTDEYIYE